MNLLAVRGNVEQAKPFVSAIRLPFSFVELKWNHKACKSHRKNGHHGSFSVQRLLALNRKLRSEANQA